jgi:general secretion pathway protein F/type IV pilus assembly protein PilC
MPTFDYIARTLSGERVTGELEAGSEAAALRQLDDQRLMPVRLGLRAGPVKREVSRRLGSGELAVLFDEMSDLLRAGVPLLRALETLGRAGANPRLGAVLRELRDEVADGKTLADAMAGRGGAFGELQVALVRAGERGGFLEDVLHRLADYLERRDALQRSVLAALTYPMAILAVGVGAIGLCLVWLVPKFKPLFEGQVLPLPSALLFAASDLLVARWPVGLAAGVAAGTGALILWKSEVGRRLWARVELRVPVLGRVLLMIALTRWCRVLGTLLASGVPILQALAVGRDAAGVDALARAVDDAAQSVRQGQGLSGPLRQSGVVPAQFLEMIAVAEESNQLEKVLLKIADTVEHRTRQQVDQAVKLIEPLILVLLAGGILFVALGILYPIFTMARTIR